MLDRHIGRWLAVCATALMPLTASAQTKLASMEQDFDMDVATGATTTQVSGDAASADILTGPPNSLLVGLRFSEFQDKPCVVRAYFGQWAFGARSNASSGYGGEVLEYAESQAKSGSCNEGSAQEIDVRGGFAVNRLRICQRRQNDRLKGAGISGVAPTPSGPQSQWGDSFERTNCNEWQPWVQCPQGQVAKGLVVHRNVDVIEGLALQCAAVSWDARPMPRTIGRPGGLGGGGARTPTVEYVGGAQQSNISGSTAAQQVLSPPSPGMTLQGFTFGERNDRPCYLDARFWNDDFSGQIQQVTFDRCDGNHGSERTVVINGGGDIRQVASSVAVCQRRNNERLKGIRLLGSRLDANGATPDAAINDVEQRTNCNQWHQPAHCPQTFVAVGVRVHYRAVTPAEIIGLGLECRAVRYN